MLFEFPQIASRIQNQPDLYHTFILDSDGLQDFYPPTYLDKICLIVNEADNLCLDRTQFIGSSKSSERLLSLFDGTIYSNIIPFNRAVEPPSVVTFLTANNTDNLDPAFLRKGRIDRTLIADVELV